MQDYFILDSKTTKMYVKYSNLKTYKKLCEKVYKDLVTIIENSNIIAGTNKAVDYSFIENCIISIYTNSSYQKLLLNNLHKCLTVLGYERQGYYYWK